jgi:hypothetical protein
MKPYIGRVAFINPLMLFVGSVYYFEPERHNIKFNGDKDELYRQYFVSLPDSAWYSEEPYIDHHIRTQRFFRIVDRIHAAGVPLGAFASFTAEFRKQRSEDSHTLTQPRPREGHTDAGGAQPTEISAAAWLSESVPKAIPEEEKTEFQKTFYGSWSAAFLSGPVADGTRRQQERPRQIVNIGGEFFMAATTVVERREITKFYPTPQLLRTYKGFNLVGYQKEIFGAPLALGPLDLTRKDTRKDRRIVRGFSETDVVRTIDFIEAAVGPTRQVESRAPAPNGETDRFRRRDTIFYDVPTLVGSYKGYNLVGLRNDILGAPVTMGEVDLTQEAARADPRILKGPTELAVVAQIDGGVKKAADPLESRETSGIIPLAGLRKVNRGAGVLLRWGR